MSKRIRFGAMIISACGLLAATGIWVSAAQGAAQPSAVPAWVALPAQAQTAAGVHLQAHDALKHPMATTITTQQAMSTAAERVGQAQVDKAVVHVTFGDFFDDEYYTPLPNGTRQYVAQGIPSYVITYDGVSVPHYGLSTGSNSEMNVVVNATTGEVIEAFSFR